MSTEKTGDSGRRYSDICGAANNRGDPCKLPAGWGTPGSGGGRCRYHGGASSGPSETEYLEDNNFATGNPGGGAPEGNTNAEIHGGFSDWRKAYERFDADTREFVDRLVTEMRETAKEHAPEVDPERREDLLKEKATVMILEQRAHSDVFTDGTGDARGFTIEEDVEIAGESYTTTKPNPALTAATTLSARQRQIAKELRLWWGFQNHE